MPQSRPIRIRAAIPADAATLAALEERVFTGERMSVRSFRRLIRAGSAITLVAEAENVISGYAMILLRRNSGIARLYSLAVVPEAAGFGIGQGLLRQCELNAAERGCRKLRLEVSRNNHRAIDFYLRAGFQQFGMHESYYADGSDALRFDKLLEAANATIPNHRSA